MVFNGVTMAALEPSTSSFVTALLEKEVGSKWTASFSLSVSNYSGTSVFMSGTSYIEVGSKNTNTTTTGNHQKVTLTCTSKYNNAVKDLISAPKVTFNSGTSGVKVLQSSSLVQVTTSNTYTMTKSSTGIYTLDIYVADSVITSAKTIDALSATVQLKEATYGVTLSKSISSTIKSSYSRLLIDVANLTPTEVINKLKSNFYDDMFKPATYVKRTTSFSQYRLNEQGTSKPYPSRGAGYVFLILDTDTIPTVKIQNASGSLSLQSEEVEVTLANGTKKPYYVHYFQLTTSTNLYINE
jgi:hypothetical protein